ncbi:hypothetical protein GGH14_002974 [Coemansia sp. RSA 370]|nr:hypothetical protein GGH14_002974 [Coemansia sp. RSA 370]
MSGPPKSASESESEPEPTPNPESMSEPEQDSEPESMSKPRSACIDAVRFLRNAGTNSPTLAGAPVVE